MHTYNNPAHEKPQLQLKCSDGSLVRISVPVAEGSTLLKNRADTCPLFAVLPAELRLLIYQQIFQGSTASYKRRHTFRGRTELSVLVPSYHRNFLLTCNQAYDEAIETYWMRTTLYGDPEDCELTFFLGSIVPDLAMLHVRHIRGLNSHERDNRPVDACLKNFKKLKVVEFERKEISNEN